MDNFYGAQLHGRVAYHDFEGMTASTDALQFDPRRGAGSDVFDARQVDRIDAGYKY